VKLVVHVDGGSRGNPGPAAAAAVVSTPDGEVVEEVARTIGRATNNVAEYRGVLLGLERAKALGADEVELINDSELVAHQINGRYKVKHPDMKPLYLDAMEALRGFASWKVRNVPRAENAHADRLVNEALDGARANGPNGSGLPAEPVEPAAPEGEGALEKGDVAGVGPHGEIAAAGGTDYATYLLIDDLLRLQRPLTPEAHDEMLFIIVHQAYELWFKLILHELERTVRELEAGRPHGARPSLQRVVRIWRVLLDQLDVLETMSPEGFLEFRDPLAPASGFQSRQFRDIESISAEPLWNAYRTASGLPEDREGQVAALVEIYRDHATPERAALHDVAELLLDHDEAFGRWRFHHVQMAAREIGTRPGTGGSPGVEYLLTTVGNRLYEPLWDVRSAL
jgi:tryptophan 2,3-dioxygenase/ribonuclease HI